MIWDKHLINIQDYLLSGKHKELEDEYFSLCSKMVSENIACMVRDCSLSEYMLKIRETVLTGLDISEATGGQSLYLEFDMRNNWETTLFICESYNPLEAQNDDWACNWTFDLLGPRQRQFSVLHEIHGFDHTNAAIYTNLYMIVLTLLSIIEALKRIMIHMPIVVAYHGQLLGFRIFGE